MESFARDTQRVSGYFTPDRYEFYKGSLSVHGELGRRLGYLVEPSLGAQRLAGQADFRRAWEIEASANLRVCGPLTLSANYSRKNYSLQGAGWYHGFYFQLGLRP